MVKALHTRRYITKNGLHNNGATQLIVIEITISSVSFS